VIDLTGSTVLELREAAANWPAPFTDYVVRGGELQPEDTPKSGKAPQAIVVVRGHPLRRRRLPMATYPFTLRIYHPDPRQVAALAGLVSDAFHDRGCRVRRSGGKRLGAYNSADVGGSGSLLEPETKWPLELVTVEITAPTIALG